MYTFLMCSNPRPLLEYTSNLITIKFSGFHPKQIPVDALGFLLMFFRSFSHSFSLNKYRRFVSRISQLPVKDQKVTIFGFRGPTVSVAAPHRAVLSPKQPGKIYKQMIVAVFQYHLIYKKLGSGSNWPRRL